MGTLKSIFNEFYMNRVFVYFMIYVDFPFISVLKIRKITNYHALHANWYVQYMVLVRKVGVKSMQTLQILFMFKKLHFFSLCVFTYANMQIQHHQIWSFHAYNIIYWSQHNKSPTMVTKLKFLFSQISS